MWNFDNKEKLDTRQALYRVWIRASDEAKAPLVSIWIDSAMTAFEAQLQEMKTGVAVAATDSLECAGESQLPEETAAEDPLHRVYTPFISAGLV